MKPEFSVLCLGLSGVGKTSLLCQLAGEPLPEEPEPTAGFSIKHCALSSAIFQVKELGGTEKLRTYWSMYYSNLDAIVSPRASLAQRTSGPLQNKNPSHSLHKNNKLVLSRPQGSYCQHLWAVA